MSASEHSGFEVRLRSRRVQRELDALQGVDYERVMSRLRALTGDPRPRGCEKIYNAVYRVRAGDYRIIYLIDQDERRIEVGGIRRRSEKTYKGIDELFH